jgi:aminoglycoside phosphotransferase
MSAETAPPSGTLPDLQTWQPVGIHHAVFRATSASGTAVYVREDDGSAALLRRLANESDVPAPRVLDQRDGWLVLQALRGAPLHDARWRARGDDAVKIIVDALLRLARNDITHGDMCLPNILGDLATGELSGIIDWGCAGQFDRAIDVASAIWSCGYNGYSADIPIAVLGSIGWARADAIEVDRLSRLWTDLAGPADPVAGELGPASP